jgi:hypothetical protein
MDRFASTLHETGIFQIDAQVRPAHDGVHAQ